MWKELRKETTSHEDENRAPQSAETSRGSSLNNPGRIKLHGKVGFSATLLAAPPAEGSAMEAQRQSNLCIYVSSPASSPGC